MAPSELASSSNFNPMRYSTNPGKDRLRFVFITVGICAGLYFAWCIYGATIATRTTTTWPPEMAKEDRKSLRQALSERKEFMPSDNSVEFFKPWQARFFKSEITVEPHGKRWEVKYEHRSRHALMISTYMAWKNSEGWQFNHGEVLLARY